MVQYLLWQDHLTGAYGVCALDHERVYGLVTASTIREARDAKELVQALNRRQLPISEFRKWVLSGGLSTRF